MTCGAFTDKEHPVRYPRTIAGVKTPFYGWAVVLVATIATFCSGPGQSFVFSVFVDPILADTGLSRVYLSTLYAFGTGISAIVVVVVARLVDRFGARLMLAGIALALGIACFAMSAAAGPIALFFGFAAMRALGQGSLPVTANILTAQWFVERRGRAMAVVVLGLAASNALLPPVTQSIIEAFDWRTAYMILGVAIWVLLIPASILIVRNRPEAVGLHPDGSTEPVREPGDETTRERGSWEAISSLNFWLLAVPLAAIPFSVTALVFHQISILSEQGLSAASAAAIFVPFAAASAAATTFSGFLIERLGPRQPLYLSMVLLLVAVLGLQLVTSPVTAILYAVLLGAGAGFQGVVAGVAWAHYYGRKGLGKVQGPATMVMISAAALAPLPLAALRAFSGDYSLGLAVLSGIPILCTVMLYYFDPRKARREIAESV